MNRATTAAKTPNIVKLFFVLCALPMLLVFPYIGTVNNPNENVRTYMTMAIVEQGTIEIDGVVGILGWVNDMARVPETVNKGPSGKPGATHYYSVKAPATSLAGVPGYWIYTKVAAAFGKHFPDDHSSMQERKDWLRNATWACRIFAVQIPCFLFLIWFERYLRAFSRDTTLRLTAVAATGLGTNYLAYTHMFASHATFAIAAFCAFAMTERELRRSGGDALKRRVSRAFLAGFFTGWCVLLEYHSLPVALILGLYGLGTFYRPTRLLAFAAGGLINVVVMMLFQWRAFGNPLTPGHKMVENAQFAAEHHQGLFGILAPQLDRMIALSFDPGFGFFGMSPFMTLGLLAIPFVLIAPGRGPSRMRRQRRIGALVWLTAMLGLWAVNSGFIQWRAGWTVGPRYLGAAPPFFAFGAVLGLERVAGDSPGRRVFVRAIAGALAFVSVLTAGTVGFSYDTLPETIARPFAQFVVPLVWTGFTSHHVGEWFGIESTIPWWVAFVALLVAPIVASLAGPAVRGRLGADRPWLRGGIWATAFAFALVAGMTPALSKPDDGSALFVMHPSARSFPPAWEPAGRDRITALRNEAERYGPRRPCMWYRIADLERIVGQDYQANRDEARAHGAPKDRCPKVYF